jgi:hypothetical protein
LADIAQYTESVSAPTPVRSHAPVQLLSSALSAIRSHPVLGWIGFLTYAAAVSFPHENVQWAVNEIAIRITHKSLYRISAGIGLTEAAIFSWLLWRGVSRKTQAKVVWRLWLLTLALIVGIWGTMTANNVELVHYPQYFPEGMALAALTLSPAETLSWIVIFGGLDESYQYWVLSRGRPSLLDFNDIYMDLLGGAAGLVFALAFMRATRQPAPRSWIRAWRRPGVIVLGSIIAAGVALWAAGVMLIAEDKSNPHYWFALGRFRAPSFWAHIVANGPMRYHTLTPVEGLALLISTIAVYAALTGGFRWDA